MIAEATTVGPIARARDFISLSKPRLSTLVMITCGGGLYLAPGSIGVLRAVSTILATAMLVGAANAMNCYLERDVDALMLRTRHRPLPAGRLEPGTALWSGWAVAAAAIPALALAANPLTAALGLAAFLIYVYVYTPMKRWTTGALWVGAVPGAIPPLMGWTAVTNSIDTHGLALFAILFAWQLPHFLSVSLWLREDYARGGLSVFSVVHGETKTRWAILSTSLTLIPVTLVPVWQGWAGMTYGVAALVLGGAMLAYAIRGVARAVAPNWARRMFLSSTLYLTLLFAALSVGANT